MTTYLLSHIVPISMLTSVVLYFFMTNIYDVLKWHVDDITMWVLNVDGPNYFQQDMNGHCIAMVDLVLTLFPLYSSCGNLHCTNELHMDPKAK